MHNPAGMRRDYARDALDAASAPADWLALFSVWFAAAAEHMGAIEVNAMQVATVDEAGRPAVRTVLLKGFDQRGITFFTNYDSAKGRELAARPYAAAVLAWVPQERQVRFSGPVERVDRAETEAYFATRPRGSQLGAWASAQSAVVASRAELDNAMLEVQRRFEARDVPAPPNWGGFRLIPDTAEFWQGRPDRMHDRLRYLRRPTGWQIERLAP